MTAQESIGIFGDLVDDNEPSEADDVRSLEIVLRDAPPKASLTVIEGRRAEFEADLKELDKLVRRVENDFLNIGKWAIAAMEKYGEETYKALWATCRPGFSISSFENYIAIARFQGRMIGLYESWRERPDCTLSMRYELAKTANELLDAGEEDPAVIDAAMIARYPEVYARRKGYAPLNAGNGADPGATAPSSLLPANFGEMAPGLQTMIDTGDLTEAKAIKIVTAATAAHTDAAHVALLFGVQGVAEVETLNAIAVSIEKAQREESVFANVFAKLHSTEGMYMLENGSLAPLASCTFRELWNGYAKACKEAAITGDDLKEWEAGNDYAPGVHVMFSGHEYKCLIAHFSDETNTPTQNLDLWSNQKPGKLIDVELSRIEAGLIAKQCGDKNVIAALEKYGKDRRFTLTLVEVVR